MPPALDDKKRKAIERDLRKKTPGSRNEIARRHGVAPGTVTKIANTIGVGFDRTQTKRATEARAIDLAAEAQSLSELMLANAREQFDRLKRKYLVYNIGGGFNTYTGHYIAPEDIPIEVVRNVHTIAGIAIDKALKVHAQTRGGLGSESALAEFLKLIANPDDPDDVDYSTP